MAAKKNFLYVPSSSLSEKRISSPLVSLIYIVIPALIFLTPNVFLSGDKTISKLVVGSVGGVGGVGCFGVGVGGVIFGYAPFKTVTSDPFVSIVSNIADINSA